MRIFTNFHNADTVRADNGWTGIIMAWNGESVDSLAYSIAKGINYIARYQDVSRWAIILSCDAAVTVTFERLITDEVRMSVQSYAADRDRAANGKKARNAAIVVDGVEDFDAVKNALKRAMSRDRLCMQAIYGDKWSAFNNEQFMYPFRRMCEEEVCEYWNLADLDTSKVDPERLADRKKDIEWYTVKTLTAWINDGTVRVKGNSGKRDVYEVTEQCENMSEAAEYVVNCLGYSIHRYEGADFAISVSVPDYGVVLADVRDGMLSIYPAHAAQHRERFSELSWNHGFEFSVDYFIATDVMTKYSIMELSLLRDSHCAKAIGASVAVESEPTTVESSAAVVPVETVIVEPVEVEHDGGVDVELAETSETIPVVEAEPGPADGSSEGNRRFRLYRNGNHYQLVVNPPAILLGNMVDIATAIGAYIAGNIERERSSNVYVYVRGLGEFMLRLSFNKQRNLYFCETKRESMFSFIWSTIDYQAGPRNGLIGTIMRALDADSERIRKATGPVTFASFEYLVATVEQKNGYSLVDSPDKASLDALNTLDWRDVETEETATEACSAVVPRAVESAPTLPAECSAETVEIPEVPPQTNEDARVLAVSEHVIPTLMTVADMFPDVPYRAVHAVKRMVEKRDGGVSKKKVAYVFKSGGAIHVVRRDRYDTARDRAVESEIAAYVAKLRQTA